ncbi:MAG: M48 family metallopeptidase [Candidatus Competibacteraceae bacterium]|nr:M48 family metallopeptidase [Candidatus Competibacteraceae bacterium]
MFPSPFRPFALLLLPLLIGLTGCDETPTGRKQLALIPEGQMAQLGARSFAEIKSTQPIETDPRINAVVRCVAQAVVDALPEPHQSWEVVVFRNPQPNAFALPGGKIGINTGILQVTETPDQLATIVGHEVAHVLVDHANERLTQELGVSAALMLVSLFLENEGGLDQELIMKGLGLGAQYGVLLPYSRAHEQEADVLGLELMARAGFDPRASLNFWRNMSQAGGGQVPELLSTHPSHGSRTETLSEVMEGMVQLQETALEQGRRPACAGG